MIEDFQYDVVVIGAGPGGYVAAIRASELGLKTAIVEKNRLGGVCLNVGCIPSKSLIHQANIYHSSTYLEGVGVKVDRSGFEYKKVFENSRKAVDTLVRGVQYLLKQAHIEVLEGEAKLTAEHEVTINGDRKVTAKNIIIATGSYSREIPGFSFDEKDVLSSTGVLMMQSLPEKMMIIGSGYIGVEFAHIFNAFGVEIHLVEMLENIIPLEDSDISKNLRSSFEKQGIRIYTATKAVSYEKKDGQSVVVLQNADENQSTITVDKIVVAVGRAPNTAGLGLEDVGVTLKNGFIDVGDYYQTSVPSIFAIGDVINTPMLAHVASKEGEIVAERLAGKSGEPRVDHTCIPGAIYCEPQIGSFGYNEQTASEQNIPYKTATYHYKGIGKAVAVDQKNGFLKLLYHPETGEILGACILGAEATELIHELLLARSSELLPQDVACMIHAHPTLSEGIMELMRNVELKD